MKVMAEEDPYEKNNEVPMSFKDKLKQFKQKEQVHDKLDNKNRTVKSGPDTDQESQRKPGPSRPTHVSVHGSGVTEKSNENRDFVGSNEDMDSSDYLEPNIGLNKQTKEMSEGRIIDKPHDGSSTKQSKFQPVETASKPPPLPPRPHTAKPTMTSLSNTYAEIDDIMMSSSKQSKSSNYSNISHKSDDKTAESLLDESKLPPLPPKSYLTGPQAAENKTTSARSNNSDYKGSDEYRDGSSGFLSPGPRINQNSQSPHIETNKEFQQDSKYSLMDKNNSDKLSESPKNEPQLSLKAGGLPSNPSSKDPSGEAFPQARIKEQEIKPDRVGPSVTREIPRGHGAPSIFYHPSHHGNPSLSTESHCLHGKGHGGQAYSAERELYQNLNLNSDIGRSKPVPISTEQNTDNNSPLYPQRSGPMANVPIFPSHQQPILPSEHFYPVRPPFGYPHHPYPQHPQMWQHGRHWYGPVDGRHSPDWQRFCQAGFQNFYWQQNPTDVHRSQSPLTASHNLQSDATRSQSPHQYISMHRKEDKPVNVSKFKLDIINVVCEMGYKHDQVESVVEKIYSDKERYEQSRDMIIGKVIDILQVQQPPDPGMTGKDMKVPEKMKKPKTDFKGKQVLKKGIPINEKSMETTYICIKGLEEKHFEDINKREKFCNFLNNLVNVDVDRSALFYDGNKLAIAAFLGDPDIGLLSKELKRKHYEGVYIDICKVDPPISIVVSGASDSINKKDIERYFQDCHQSGGGHVESCDEQDGVYIVCFKNHTDVENVCQGFRRHKMKGTTLYVSPRFESQFGDIWDASKHKAVIPTEMSVTWVDSHLSRFILSSPTCCNEFNHQIQSEYAEICSSFGADYLCIKCLLKQSTPNIHKLSKSWESNVRRKFDELVTRIVDRKEVMCSSSLWEPFKERLKDVKDENSSDVKDENSSEFMLVEDDENLSVVIVGMKSMVQCQYDELLIQKQKLETELERKNKIKTETKRFHHEQVIILNKYGIITEVNNIAEDLKVVPDTENGEIQFTGIEEDIKKAQVKIYEALNEKILTGITSLSEQQMKLIKNETNIKLIQEQFEDKNIKANIIVSGEKLQIISSSVAGDSKAEQIVKQFTKQSIINLGDNAVTVLSKDAWTNKLTEMEQKHRDQVLICVDKDSTITITTVTDIHNEVHSELKTLIGQYTTHSECIEVEKEGHYMFLLQYSVDDLERLQNDLKRESVQITLVKDGIEISGTSSGIKLAKPKVYDIINGIKEKKIEHKGPGIGHVLCHDNMERLHMISEHTRTVILLEDVDNNGNYMYIGTGDIANAKADVLVCTTSPNLNLSSGKTCRSLSNAAGGNTLQRNCDTKYPQGIKEGEIASVKGGNLHCKKVYFGVLPQWKPGDDQPLKTVFKFIQDCLRKAEKKGFTSLAFSALGTGASGYPATSVANMMYSCVTDYDKCHQKSKIKKVGFVVHHKDNITLKAFKDEEGKIKAGTVHVGIKCVNGTQIQLVTGELAKEEGDVIVCGTSHALNLTSGKASNNLLHVAGQNLQKECKKNYPEGIEPGQIAAVKGGNLKCQEVYFGCLPEWKTEQFKHHKTLWKFVESCMLQAHMSGYSTILFPALGTGALGYPADRAAHLMFDSVIKFDNCHTRNNINNVKFVLYHKDQQTLKAFQQKEEEILRLSQTGAQGNWGRYKPKVKATVAIGQIEKQKVDVIICCTGPTLNLSQGKITQALLNVGGTSLQRECNQKYPLGIQNEDLADIGPGNLPSKHVYLGVLPKYGTDKQTMQTAEKALHKFVSKCMYKASKAGYKSIAVPAVGTGKYNQYPHHVVASVIFGAIDKFDRKNPVTSLKEVRCVSVTSDRKSCQAFKMEERKRYVPSVTRATRQKFYQGKAHGATKEFGRRDEVSLYLYSDSDDNIKSANQAIDKYCKSEIKQISLKDEMIEHLPREKKHAVENLERQYPIKLEIKRKEIILEGRKEDLLIVNDEINQILRDLNKYHHSEREANILAEKIQWYFKERQMDRVKLIPYSSKINLKIEQAFRDKNVKVVEFLSNDGNVHKVDLKRMHEYPAHNTADRVDVVRREKMAASAFPLPKEWSDMGDTEQYKEAVLTPSSKEYKDVEKLFKDSVFQGKYQGSYSQSTFTVLHVRLMIYTQGNAWYGNGVYFANDAGYSCADWASKPDASGIKYMYMVRVLTGIYCQGVKGMRVLPARTGNILFDSAVETTNNPTEFIIFNDTQAYPQYMIHFKK
ncbi:hypothetical protein KUTeg_005234 [Tegillarca granosa]|uniref:Poly [ADP-ribose] polymerase n=1 Tax=Tegillarca granosa TaxID=220873 RepID=A0ABQ9FJ61_TEGGR|nr:hypothetical protein KUTeg_005234 [Tegillarca granosa]